MKSTWICSLGHSLYRWPRLEIYGWGFYIFFFLYLLTSCIPFRYLEGGGEMIYLFCLFVLFASNRFKWCHETKVTSLVKSVNNRNSNLSLFYNAFVWRDVFYPTSFRSIYLPLKQIWPCNKFWIYVSVNSI